MAAGMKVYDLLIACPNVGPAIASKLLRRVGMSPCLTLEKLTSRQRNELAGVPQRKRRRRPVGSRGPRRRAAGGVAMMPPMSWGCPRASRPRCAPSGAAWRRCGASTGVGAAT